MRIRKTLPPACIATLMLFFASLTLPAIARAATHWVSPTGAAAWGSCVGSTALSGTAACSLATANAKAVAGDLVYLRGGTYSLNITSGAAIQPANSGTCSSYPCTGGVGANPIVFAAYSGEMPVLVQANATNGMMGIWLQGNNWTKITGITFKNFTLYDARLDAGSSYNELSYNTFVNDPGYQAASFGIDIGDFTGATSSKHNWIHHNYLSSRHDTNPCGEAIDMIRIGNSETGPVSSDNYNTIEHNYIEYGGHSTVLTNSKYDVVKNNIGHNEPWIAGCATSVNIPTYDNSAYNGLYGHRNFAIGDSDRNNKAYTLIEGNRLGFASTNPGNGGSSGIDLESPGNLVRYNFVYAGMDSGIYFKWANVNGVGTGGSLNYVYNNTVYSNGHGWNAALYGTGNLAYNGQGIAQFTYGGNTLNIIKNNIAYGNGQGDICDLGWGKPSCTADSTIDIVANNWLTTNGDPKFTNPALSNPLSQNLLSTVHGYATTPVPDFRLQSSSPAIDGGTWLTTAGASGSNSTTLTVGDVFYFQDGTWGSDLARGVTLFPDWIAIGSVTNTVRISSINYATKTITLASPMTWSAGAHIWLYRKSDGAVVLSGAAPDYGASEFLGSTGGTPRPQPPTNLQLLVK